MGSVGRQIRCILSMLMLHHFLVFLNALSRKLSSWKNLDAHSLEHLVSEEKWTKFFREAADVSCSRSPFALIVTPFASNFPELSGVSLFLIFFQNHGVGCGNLSTILNFVCARIYQNLRQSFVRAWHFHFNASILLCRTYFLWLTQFFFQD